MKFDRVIAVRNNKTVYRDGDRCVKVFVSDYAKADILHEAVNQARVEETGLMIPKILEVTVTEGKWAIVSEYIRGKTLARLMEEDKARMEECLTILAAVHAEIHTKSGVLLGTLEDELNRGIAASELNATARFALHDRLKGMPRENKICHGDMNPTNIILDGEGVPHILDWSHATQGNPAADAARTWLYFRKCGDADSARRYLELYCQKSGADKKSVLEWIPIVAAAQLAKSSKKDQNVLLALVNSGDYE